MTKTRIPIFVTCLLSAGIVVRAQQPTAQPAPPAVRSAREMAQVDLTGVWVAQVTEDWRLRMITPPKGDYIGLPLNAAGRRIADAWDPAKDAAEGAQCKAFGAAALMRHPLRMRISWVDEYTLKLETDLGRQTRLLRFKQEPVGARSLQGYSAAQWTRPVSPARGGPPAAGAAAAGRGAERASAPPPSQPAGGLKVVTTNLTPGYLRKNGVPYSENAIVTEYYDRVSFFGTDYVQLVTVVEDPTYLTAPFIVSNQFKRETDGSKWNPQPCTIDPPVGTLRRSGEQ